MNKKGANRVTCLTWVTVCSIIWINNREVENFFLNLKKDLDTFRLVYTKLDIYNLGLLLIGRLNTYFQV